MVDLILNFVVILETMEHGFWCGVSKYGEVFKNNARFCEQCGECSFPTLLFLGSY